MKFLKRVSRILLAVVFILSGLNHFIMPDFYLPLIPDYLPFHGFINIAAGLAELGLGLVLLLANDFWRSWAAMGMVLLLILFIPSHVWMIQEGGCLGEFCVGLTAAWLRLVIIQPILIFWAYSHHRHPTA